MGSPRSEHKLKKNKLYVFIYDGEGRQISWCVRRKGYNVQKSVLSFHHEDLEIDSGLPGLAASTFTTELSH